MDLRNVSLNLEIEDLEVHTDKCCGSSTTLPFCTCPIRFTDCCDRFDYTDQQ
jgi:hypothetical protein